MDAHSPEYVAAVCGMHDTYGRPAPSVGDWINGKSAGRHWAGQVLEVTDRRTVVVLLGDCGAQVEVPLTDITIL
jgi:hypothetical protein